MESNYCKVCKKSAAKSCSSCHQVYYCSVEHQKSDWKTHKNICAFYEIKFSKKFGRHLVASRDIPAGAIIMKEAAIMLGPKQDTHPICLGCYKDLNYCHKSKIYYCSKCKVFPMCGKSCEELPIHKENECKIFEKGGANFRSIENLDEGHDFYECILTIRCLMLKTKDPKKWEKLINMQAQNEIRKKYLPEMWARYEINIVRLLRDQFKIKSFSEEEIYSVLGYADINSFQVKTSQIDITGLYDNTFLMAHDCISNTSHSFSEDLKMIVHATIPIKKGELITTTYTGTLTGTEERRCELRQYKFFECSCVRCSDPTEMGTNFSSIKCSKCFDGFLLPRNPLHGPKGNPVWTCSAHPICAYEMKQSEVTNLIESIREEIRVMQTEVVNPIPLIEDFLKKYKFKVLHPNHYLIIDMESHLYSLYGKWKGWRIPDLNLNQLARKEELCRHVLEILDILEPGYSKIRGVALYELHAAVYFSSQLKYKQGGLTKEKLREQLEEVLLILNESYKILSFDFTNTAEGKMAQSIPASISSIKKTLAEL